MAPSLSSEDQESLKAMGCIDLKMKHFPGPEKSIKLRTWRTEIIPFSIAGVFLETERLNQQYLNHAYRGLYCQHHLDRQGERLTLILCRSPEVIAYLQPNRSAAIV